jgi:hypothetical protein
MSLMKKIKAELKRRPKPAGPKPKASLPPAPAPKPDLKRIVLVLLGGLKSNAAPHQLAIQLNVENVVPFTGRAWTVQSVESTLRNLRSYRHELYRVALDLATTGEISYSDYRLLQSQQ